MNRGILKIVDGIDHYQCSKCKKWKPATIEFFYRKPACFLGLESICRDCYKEYHRTLAKRKKKRRDLCRIF